VRVIWSPTALRHVIHAYEYLEDFNPAAANALADALLAAGDSLQNFPYRGRPIPGTDMRDLVTAYPYIIRYRMVRDAVHVLRVRHTARQL
jgi:toxin ParE1/3/4